MTTASQSFQIRVFSVYQQWAGTNTVSPTVTTTDDDSDGITNLAEFAFGTDPQASGSITTTGQPDLAYGPSAPPGSPTRRHSAPRSASGSPPG